MPSPGNWANSIKRGSEAINCLSGGTMAGVVGNLFAAGMALAVDDEALVLAGRFCGSVWITWSPNAGAEAAAKGKANTPCMKLRLFIVSNLQPQGKCI